MAQFPPILRRSALDESWQRAQKVAFMTGRLGDYAYVAELARRYALQSGMGKSAAYRDGQGAAARGLQAQAERQMAKPTLERGAGLLRHVEPRQTARSVVQGLGMPTPQADAWTDWLTKTAATCPSVPKFKQSVAARARAENLEMSQANALGQRAVNYHQSATRSQGLSKAAGDPGLPPIGDAGDVVLGIATILSNAPDGGVDLSAFTGLIGTYGPVVELVLQALMDNGSIGVANGLVYAVDADRAMEGRTPPSRPGAMADGCTQTPVLMLSLDAQASGQGPKLMLGGG